MEAEKDLIFQTYRRQPLVLVKGRGSYVWDDRGRKYLDFFSGLAVNNLGHCHPAITRAVTSQVRKLVHTSNVYYTVPQIQCARELVKRTFPGKVFFCNSGGEAIECAIKLARRWGKRAGGKHEIISFENSFHGRSMGALSLTGQEKYRKDFDPLLEKVSFARFNDIDSVRKLVSAKTSAVFIEPVQGEGGVIPARRDFLSQLRELCDRNGLLLVFDEVQCGLGRTGELFGYQSLGVKPDVLTIAKGLGGGLPIGACLARSDVAGLLSFGDHASTFGGNPVACSASCEVLRAMSRPFLSQVRKKGAALVSGLQKIRDKFPHLVADVRGIGLMICSELKVPGSAVVDFCRDKNLLLNCTQEKVVRFLPPLTVSLSEIRSALSTFERALARQ